jgi:uncharacterized protein (TIGR02246 family)
MRATMGIIGLLGLLLTLGGISAQEKKADKREADVAAVKKLIGDFITALDKGDAKAVSAFWTADGEFINEDGKVLEGRSAIEKAYTAHLSKKLPGKLETQIESIRFPSADSAVLDITLRRKDGDELISSSTSQSFLVREAGAWKLAVVHEWERDVTIDQKLSDLAWLIGSWSAANKDKLVEITYEWDANKAFIKGGFSVKEGTKVIESGTHIIGKDNLNGVLRSWSFQADGGFGGGTWTKDGKRWVVDSAGVLPDGDEMTATYIFAPLSKDAFTWQAIDRTLGGVKVPNTEPVKVTRKK